MQDFLDNIIMKVYNYWFDTSYESAEIDKIIHFHCYILRECNILKTNFNCIDPFIFEVTKT